MKFIEHNLLADNRQVDQVVRFEEDFFTDSNIDTVHAAHHVFRTSMWEWSNRRHWVLSRDYPFLVRFADGTYGVVHRDRLRQAMAAVGRSLQEI